SACDCRQNWGRGCEIIIENMEKIRSIPVEEDKITEIVHKTKNDNRIVNPQLTILSTRQASFIIHCLMHRTKHITKRAIGKA
ncbi:MAG TPA: hypothetical protein PK486_08410, partial [Trichococcus flocculiformis]|nr:hypothetical protein [Trichococcus flocculiformis]